ncbi:hypothetical protein MBLNU457_g2483t1 [Dothideomycetes sp. NU457]
MFSKMPWSHHGEEHEEKEQEESLTTILSSQEDRTELTLLIANCTETMRKTIVDTFDANQTGHKADIVKDPKGQNEWTDAVKADIAAQEKAQREQAAREKELSAPKMQETKNAALKFFDDWRENVISRVGEVVNSQEAARHQKERAHAQHHHIPSKRISSTTHDYEDTDKAMKEAFPPTETPLTKFDEPKRALILHSILLLMLSLEHYSAHSRVLLLHLTSSLHLSVKFLAEDESKIARGLLEAANMKADEEQKKAAEENASSRKWKVGLAAVGGATLLAVTGGLAAPLLAAGVGSVMGGLGLGATATAGYLGTMAGSSVIVGGLFGAYGARMSSQMMDAYAREVEDFAFIPVRTHHRPRKIEKEYRRLRVAIGISGWLSSKEDVVEPWLVIGNGMETFALRYELEALLALGNALTTMISSAAWGYAKSELIKRTVFSALTAALWPLGLLKISRIVDNPFSVAKGRSDKAGELLADALINKAQGERPVTLVGYSLGARVIYICLRKLAERKAFGLVESVVLLGAPTPSTAADWRMMRSVVSGRLVNVYSTNDYILGFLYRSSSVQYGIAGLQPIEGVAGVQNVDVTDLVTGHTSYRWLSGVILRKIGFEDIDASQLKKQEAALAEEEKKEAEEAARERNQQNTQPGAQGPLVDTSEKPLGPDGVPSDQAVQDLEKKVDAKNQETMMSWMTEKLQLGGATAATAAVKAKTWYLTRGMPAAGANKAVGQVEGQVGKVDGQVDVHKSAPQPNQEADLAKSRALGAEEEALGGPQL